MDGHSALLALLSEAAGLPFNLLSPPSLGCDPLHICLTASREGREGGCGAPSLEGVQPSSICLCLHPCGQEHVSTQLAGDIRVPRCEYHRLCYPGRKEECCITVTVRHSTAPSRGCCGTFVQPLFVSLHKSSSGQTA